MMVEQDLLESIFQFGDLIIIVDIVAYTITHVYIYKSARYLRLTYIWDTSVRSQRPEELTGLYQLFKTLLLQMWGTFFFG